jgi:16S rRNA (guanine966-N2)-methyltransferase
MPALKALNDSGWIAPGGIIVIEVARNEEVAPPEGFEMIDDRHYGAARVVYLRAPDGPA